MEEEVSRLFEEKECLAPMVRVGTLPFRILALKYGADTVWGEEIVDRAIIKTTRKENARLGTVDFCTENGKSIIFRTCDEEKGRFVFQIGTSASGLALQAAQHVEKDVSAIDINMGCPKPFSTGGGMGAALLSKPEVAEDIIKTLRRNLTIPVSCKVRLQQSTQKTVEFAQQMEKAGAQAITVHMRTTEITEKGRALWEELQPVVQAVGIPVIANGDLYSREIFQEIKKLSGCSSVMIARPALYNVSLFDKNAPSLIPRHQVIKDYASECIRWDNNIQNTKYTIMEMMRTARHPEHILPTLSMSLPNFMPDFQALAPCKQLQPLVALYGLEEEYQETHARWLSGITSAHDENSSEPARRYSESYFKKDSSMNTDIEKTELFKSCVGNKTFKGQTRLQGGSGKTDKVFNFSPPRHEEFAAKCELENLINETAKNHTYVENKKQRVL